MGTHSVRSACRREQTPVRISALALASLLFAWSAAAEQPDADLRVPPSSPPFDEAAYLAQVKPLLAARCFACHGALKTTAGLRLDTVASMKQGGDSGPAIVAGSASASPLMARVAHANADERMPPAEEGEPLSPQELELLRRWLDAGAPRPADEQPEPGVREHWSFRPRTRAAVPNVAAADGDADGADAPMNNPIDAFLAVKRQALGLAPQPAAPRDVLVRRLFFDLIGLPPKLDELEKWRSDGSPRWYEALVDRLLADPRYAERWARHWMDIWRYSDGSGLGQELRNSHYHVWHWRDWIVESLDADVPYDEMVRQMLAADELYPNDLTKLRATGLLVRNYNRFSRTQWLEETVEHVGKGFLGLTFNCARCHDHKYDPIEQPEYFQLRAVFEPHLIRVDCTADEADVGRDGIPRVYDASLDIPTYRLIRGQESQPDTSAPLLPGVPKSLDFAQLEVAPTPLPVDAVHPERRTWVVDAHMQSAQKRLSAAEEAVVSAQAAVKGAPADADAQSRLDDALWEVEIARAAWTSVHRRAAAMRAQWSVEAASDADRAAATDTARLAAVAAVRAEREQAIVQAKRTVDQKERQLAKLTNAPQKGEQNGAEQEGADLVGQRNALQKDVADAQAALSKLQQEFSAPGDAFAPLPGTVRVETRHISNQGPDPVKDFPSQSTGRRTALARWITHPQNPLTARVAVNHMWNRHLGAPLVPTVFDFGRKGTPPHHPELLDWLACELVDSGWSMKHVHRLIVTSSTYRLSSSLAHSGSNASIDPDNRTFWRRAPLRLEAQAVRDAILEIAAELDFTRGGPPIGTDAQGTSKRRSLYFLHSNNDRNLFLAMFDDATTQECYRRDESIVPQQALALSNSRLAYEASRIIAARLSHFDGGAAPIEDGQFIRRAFPAILTTDPTERQIAACSEALAAWRALPEVAQDANPELRSRANLVRTLLNDNDFVTLR